MFNRKVSVLKSATIFIRDRYGQVKEKTKRSAIANGLNTQCDKKKYYLTLNVEPRTHFKKRGVF